MAERAFTPEEIAEGKAARDAIWAREPVEVVAEANIEVEETPAGITQGAQGAQGAPEPETRGGQQEAKPKPRRRAS